MALIALILLFVAGILWNKHAEKHNAKVTAYEAERKAHVAFMEESAKRRASF